MFEEIKYGKLGWNIDDKDDYRIFTDCNEATLWGMKYYKEWAEQYKKVKATSEKVLKGSMCSAPIECYCGYSYCEINEFMRYDVDSEDCTYRELSDILAIALATAPRIPENIVLYRVVCDEFIEMLIKKNRQNPSIPAQEKGYMSTSLIKNIANEDEPYANQKNLLKIFAPKDTIGVYVNAVTRRSEEEMLLFPNMFLALASYPYHDKEVDKMVYECKLLDLN